MTDNEKIYLRELMGLLANTSLKKDEVKGVCFCLAAHDRNKTTDNLKEMIQFLKDNPEATYDDIVSQEFIILGID